MAGLGGHEVVVQHDSEDWDIAANRGFKIQAGHAERRVAHKVDAELFRRGQLRAHNQPQSGSERVRFAPADVTAGRWRLIKGDELIARASRIVRDDRVFGVDAFHKFRDDAVRIDRHLFRSELWHPLTQPWLTEPPDPRSDSTIPFWIVRTLYVFQCFDELSEHGFGVAEDRIIRRIVFVYVPFVVSGVNDDLSGWDWCCDDAMAREAAADSKNHVSLREEFMDG